MVEVAISHAAFGYGLIATVAAASSGIALQDLETVLSVACGLSALVSEPGWGGNRRMCSQEGRDIEGYRRAIRHLCGDVLPDDILFQLEMPFITCPQKRVTDLDAESMARVPHPLRPMQTPRSSLFPAVAGPCFHSLSLCAPPPDRNVS